MRRLSVEITSIFVALLAMVGAFVIWWGGTSAAARPIASGLPLLMLPIAMAFRSAPAASPRRAAQHLLLWISIGIAVTLAVSENGLLINNNRDGTSALLAFWSPRWELWSLAPTFVAPQWAGIAWLHMLWWVVMAAAAAIILARLHSARAGVSALMAFGVLGAALIAVAISMPWLPAGPPIPKVDLSARSRLAALDGFDARVRPTSFSYDPARMRSTGELVSELVMSVKPMQRSDPQPVRVIHNGRFSLPAGTYIIAVDFDDRTFDRPFPLSLQIGRNGPPLHTWSMQPQPNQHWETTLWLPVDANFVGLRGPVELERAVTSIAITPKSVVDAGDRPLVPTVLAAAAYQAASVFFHEENMYPEPQGFWTMGAHASRMTVAVPPGQTTPVVLRVHSGAKPNTATFSTFGWQQTLDLAPGNIAEVELPLFPSGVVPLTIDVNSGFYPREADPASTDPRFLGVWVELKAPGSTDAPAITP